MRIQCTSCGQTMQIPDDKLPDAPRFLVRCPQCQQAVTVDRNAPDQAQTAGSQAPPAPSAPVQAPAAPGPEVPPGLEPDVFPPGARTAFVDLRDPSWGQAAQAHLAAQGFFTATASSPGEAVGRLRLNSYELILVQDDGPGRQALAEIAAWNGLKRRESNVVLAGRGAASLDPQAAFLAGVNAWLNLDDAGRVPDLLVQAMDLFELHYRPLNEAKAAQG